VYDSPYYESEARNELSAGQCEEVLGNYSSFVRENGFDAVITFMGGDPCLKPGLEGLVEKAARFSRVGILGNPLSEEKAAALKDAGLSFYQLSVDGMEKTHDWFRKPGSFAQTLAAGKTLKKLGISTGASMTVCRKNAPEVCDVMRRVHDEGFDRFVFARLVPVGRGKSFSGEMFSPAEFKALLQRIDATLEEIGDPRFAESTISSEPLFGLLYAEQGRLDEFSRIVREKNPYTPNWGVILADGTVLARRLLPAVIGKVPKQSFSDIYSSRAFKDLWNWSALEEKCSGCELLEVCKKYTSCGRTGITNALAGSAQTADPQCWKTVN